MERLNKHLLEELDTTFDVYLTGPSGAKDHVSHPERTVACPATSPYIFILCSILKSVWLARRIRPVLVIAGSGPNALAAWAASVVCGSGFIVYLHGLDIIVDNFWYRRLFLPVIRRADAWFVNSRATAHVAIQAGLDEARIHILHPGVAFPDLLPSSGEILAWRVKWQLDDAPVMLAVGRLTRRKGLAEFVRHSLPQILDTLPNALLVIVGEEPKSALAPKGDALALHEAISALHLGKSVRFLGKIPDSELKTAYASARVLVFPVCDIPGDMEGFGMVAIEAAAYGTPTVAFNVGGVGDAVSEGTSGRLIHPGDYAAYTKAVIGFLEGPPYDAGWRSKSRSFAQSFAWPRFGARLRALVSSVVTSISSQR